MANNHVSSGASYYNTYKFSCHTLGINVHLTTNTAVVEGCSLRSVLKLSKVFLWLLLSLATWNLSSYSGSQLSC